jgi:hypothetical protein
VAFTLRLAVVTAFSGRVSPALRAAVIVATPVHRTHRLMSTSVTRLATAAFRCTGNSVARKAECLRMPISLILRLGLETRLNL